MNTPNPCQVTELGCLYKGVLVAMSGAAVGQVNLMHEERLFSFDVNFSGLDGHKKQTQFPVAALYGDPRNIATALAAQGFIVMPGEELGFQKFLAWGVFSKVKETLAEGAK